MFEYRRDIPLDQVSYQPDSASEGVRQEESTQAEVFAYDYRREIPFAGMVN
ncbi:hypothetical protein [Mesobacillus foraminis]|uniref:Uncharacterized protein n=1 Tax=Mesobacillus foraminis TaxID=279826 RepID=A0A4R2BFD4_9BACI|nr:hypothetical protein [Mesobacillus foraminis]TCN25516.1 hypothetical protein EV146_105173 [Mesobacillus foraminis]